jgi:hypothetical protein
MDIEKCIAYLRSSPIESSCEKHPSGLEVSHDEVHRFLLSIHHTGLELFVRVRDHIDLYGSTLSVDDSTLYSNSE